MAQETEGSKTRDVFRTSEEDLKSGRDLPDGDGTVSDEQVSAISGEKDKNKETGQDHSTENYEETLPTDGVGAVQDREDTTSDVARIED